MTSMMTKRITTRFLRSSRSSGDSIHNYWLKAVGPRSGTPETQSRETRMAIIAYAVPGTTQGMCGQASSEDGR